MRKAIYLLTTLLVFTVLQSCTDETDLKQDWTLTIKTVMTALPEMEGYPFSMEVTQDYNDLTEDEIKEIADATNAVTTMSMGDMTIISTITATYALKK